MAFDRDLNVALVVAARRLPVLLRTGWEMLAATGVRGLRLVHEAGGFDRFHLAELHPQAAERLVQNCRPYESEGARGLRWDSRVAPAEAPFEYVDLDPYGSPVPWLETALGATAPDGVLAVTATDQRVLAGREAGAAERRYGGRPVRARLAGEGGLRLLLATAGRMAAAQRRRITPLLAYVGDHHVRAYVRVGGPEPGVPGSPIAVVGGAEWEGPPLGSGSPFGPLWMGPLVDPACIAHLQPPLGAAEPLRLGRWLDRLREEAAVDVPFFYESNTLARELRLGRPPGTDAMVRALRETGHRAARSVVRDGAWRTDATFTEVARLARSLVQSQNDRVRA